MKANFEIINAAYNSLWSPLCSFIARKIGNREDAEDIAQDVFVKALEYDDEISEGSFKAFLFKTAANMVTDYFRHLYCTRRVHGNIMETSSEETNCTESEITANDLIRYESEVVKLLPPQRQRIYCLSRFYEKTIGDISCELLLSVRTVENHLRLARRDVRMSMARAIG